MEREPITIEAEATVLESVPAIRRACSAVIIRGSGPDAIFAPPVQPEMRGRRATGVMCGGENVTPEMKGQQVVANPDHVIVPKRAAKSVAEELTGCPISMHERNGRVQIEVIVPGNRIEFEATTWFLALASLKAWADKRARARL